jgi:bifunctional DNase/RNase
VTESIFTEVVIDSIRISLMSQQRIVILREKNDERYLPIWIGPYEAEAITIALQEVEVSRPLTHDLLNSVFRMLNGHLLRVEVTALEDETYYGNLVVEVNGETINIDSRPSDAIALAVRAHIPIMVDQEVMENAGIIPDEHIESDVILSQREKEQLDREKGDTPEAEPGSEERLSVFEDFLDNLDATPKAKDDDEDEGKDEADNEEDEKK